MTPLKYPTLEQVNATSYIQLAEWYRFLPSPKNEDLAILNRICERFKELGGMTPEISKAIGWGHP